MKYAKYVWGKETCPKLTAGQIYEVVYETNDCLAVIRNDGATMLVDKYKFEEGSIMTEIEKRVDDLLIELEETGGTTFMRWNCPYHIWCNGDRYTIVADGGVIGSTFTKKQVVTFIRNKVGE